MDGGVRYLRNVMGLWVLQQCLADWGLDGSTSELEWLLDAAGRLAADGPVVDIDHPRFLAPGPMVRRLEEAVAVAGRTLEPSRAAVVRCVLDSLAEAFARTVGEAGRLSGRSVEVIHLVGGGARNRLLCRLTADRAAVPVLAGPVEATALGNVLVQARTAGRVSGGLEDLTLLAAASSEVVEYRPSGPPL